MPNSRKAFRLGWVFLAVVSMSLSACGVDLPPWERTAQPLNPLPPQPPTARPAPTELPTPTPVPTQTIQPTPTTVVMEFQAFANQAWQDTGIKIQPGATLTIKYISGLWSPWAGGNYDGIGSGGDPKCSCNVIPGVSHAALIGKIGDGNPFLVGNSFTQKIGQAGSLFLGINDTRVSDNSGSLKVRIVVSY